MSDGLKELIANSGSLFHDLYDFIATSLIRETLSLDAQQKRKALTSQLGGFIEKMKANSGVLSGPSPIKTACPRMETPSSVQRSPLLSRRQPPPPGPPSVAPPTDNNTQEFYTDMRQPEEGNGEMEEFYTDMVVSSAASSARPPPPSAPHTPARSQGQRAPPPPPESPPPPEEEETYADMGQEGSVAEEFYTDMTAENAAAASGPMTPNGAVVKADEEEGEFYTDMGQTGDHAHADPDVALEEDFYDDISLRAKSPPVRSPVSEKPPDRIFLEPPSAEEESPYAQSGKVKKVKAASLTSIASRSGYLEKLGGYRGKAWQRRFCILDDICLYFFGSDKDKSQHNQVLLVRNDVSANVPELKLKDKKKDLVFKIFPLENEQQKKSNSAPKVYYFRAPDQEMKDSWVMALAKACRKGTSLVGRHTILREYVAPPSPSLERQKSPLPDEALPITPTLTSESETDSPVSKRKQLEPPMKVASPLFPSATAAPRPTSQFMPATKSQLAVAGSARPHSQFVPSSRPDPVVDTKRIYYQDKWFNYDDVYVAAWDCRASAKDELGLQRGNLVLLVEKRNGDWWFCTAGSVDDDFRGKSGLVPSAYLMPAFELA